MGCLPQRSVKGKGRKKGKGPRDWGAGLKLVLGQVYPRRVELTQASQKTTGKDSLLSQRKVSSIVYKVKQMCRGRISEKMTGKEKRKGGKSSRDIG